MEPLPVKGVVKNGQVVLETPLNLPDGTIVTLTPHDATQAGGLTDSPDAAKRKLLELINRLDLIDDPDWRAKAEPDRVAFTEKLILEMAGMWANRPELGDDKECAEPARHS